MKPRVVFQLEASLDERVDHLDIDLGRFYAIAASFGEDATLTGADTVLAALKQLGHRY